jgi:type I restriction enzyme, S subunit
VKVVPLGVVAEVTLGKMLQPSRKADGERSLPYLRAAHVQPHGHLDLTVEANEMWFSEGEQATLDLRAGDVVVVEGGAVGRSAYLPEDMPGWGFQNALLRLRPRDGGDGRYIDYCLQSAVYGGEIEAICTAVSIAHFTAEKVGRFRIPDNDEATRRAIVDYLDVETREIDATIGKLDELSATFRHRAKEVITKSVFGLGPGHTHAAADAYSPLSGIPDHWDRTKFGYEFTESTERSGDEPPGDLLSISEHRGVELNTRTDGQQASLDVSKYRVVRPGQLAANMMWLNHGGLGVSSLTGYISPDYKAFWISDRFESRYVHHLFRSSRYIDYFAAIATGVRPNAQRVTKTVLDATPVPLPPPDEQIRIADELDEANAQVDAMLAKVADLRSLLLERRAALITNVVTGRKEVG